MINTTNLLMMADYAERIKHFVYNGLPKDWKEQMNGEAKLSYL